MSAPTWTQDTADAMVDAARRAHHSGAPVDLEVTCRDGSTFVRTYLPQYGRYVDSVRQGPAAHLLAMSTLIVGVSGKKRHGKNTASEVLVREHGFTEVAFGDALKQMVYALDPIVWSSRWLWRTLRGRPMRVAELVDAVGWEAAKELPEVRRLLQKMGTEAGREILGADIWVRTALAKAAASEGPVVITDVRFPNEAEAVRATGGVLLRVQRPSHASTDNHPSETALDDYDDWDAVLVNDGSVADLQHATVLAVAPARADDHDAAHR